MVHCTIYSSTLVLLIVRQVLELRSSCLSKLRYLTKELLICVLEVHIVSYHRKPVSIYNTPERLIVHVENPCEVWCSELMMRSRKNLASKIGMWCIKVFIMNGHIL